jgi:uncharacterized protein (TIGR02594 family)
VQVAEYFLVDLKVKSPSGYYWNEEWPISRPNPVITGFFTMTNVLPNKADDTYWCAAFVNFCLGVAGRPINWSAWALDFTKYGTTAEDPQPGDLVVFSRHGGGHVGFFITKYDDSSGSGVIVLGGNQGGGSPGTKGAVSKQKFSYNSGYHIEDFRRIPNRT